VEWAQRLAGSFHYREYRSLYAGSMIAQLVFRMQDVVLAWQMLQLTGSPFWVGMVAFATNLPLLIWSPFTGTLADRFRRQNVLAVALGGSALSIVGLSLFTALGTASSWHIVLTAFVCGTGFILYSPARLALLPSTVPGNWYLSASTVEYSSTRLVGFLAAVSAGLLLERAGVAAALLVEAGLLLLGIVAFLQINGGLPGRQAGGLASIHFISSMREALAHIRADRPLWALAALGLFMAPIGMIYQKMMSVFARDALGAGPSTLGWLLGLSSLGAATAGLSLAGIGDRFSRGKALLVASAILSSGIILFAFCRETSVALAMALGMGLAAGVYLTLSNVLFQTRPPDELRGRVVAAWSMIWGVVPFTTLLAGALAERWGVVAVVAASGGLCLALTLCMALFAPRLREL
jgi:MFS family permease